MRNTYLGLTRGLPALTLLLLLAACGGESGDGTKGGGATPAADSKGGVASGVVSRGVTPSSTVPAGGATSGSNPGVGAAGGTARGQGAASNATPRGIGSGSATSLPLAPHASGEILVRFRATVSELNKSRTLSRVAATRLRAFRVIKGLEHHRLPPNVSVAEALEDYRQDPNVLYAEPNYVVHTTAIPDDTRFGELWGLHNTGQSGGTSGADIDALGAWDIATGSSNVVVAVIDTGIDYNHPDLSANMFRNTPDCIANGIDDDGNGRIDDCYGIDTANNDSDPMDDNRHGTHVAGTIGAQGNNGSGVAGINWNVNLMACKFLAASGSGTTAGAIACLEYVRTMKDRGVNIVATNNSWGGGGFSQALFDAIKGHQEAGILFVAAAGNGNAFGVGLNNDQTPFYPCNYNLSNVICVAASTRTDERATFSNYGRRTVHIGAPGAEILSTTLTNSYTMLNGTSMATPHVTGTAALLKAADPSRDWRAIRNLILASGDNVPSMANTITQKRLNALGALNCVNSTAFSRLSPIADTVLANVDTPLNLSVLNINCAIPNGDVVVTVNPGGETVTLLDDGAGVDQAAGDGNYSGQWIPATTGSYTLTFPDGSELAVTVSSPLISVTPDVLDFGTVNANAFVDRAFMVQNAASGTLSGSASTAAPFAIQSGGSYSLSAGQSQTVTVRLSPTVVGTVSGTVNFTGGGAASKIVTGVVVPPATLAASPTSAAPGTTITVSWSGIATPTTRDWIGIYQPGAPDTSYHLGWLYVSGAANGSVPFTLATTLAPGTYELRLFSNGGYSRLAVTTITVVPGCTGGSLNASPTSVAPGGSVTATWSAVCASTSTDWIGLYLPGALDSSYLAYRYTTGTASGSVPFTIPTSVAPGTYELRLFSNNSGKRLAVSNSFQVVVAGCSGSSLGASPANVPLGGSVTATWSGLCGPTTRDWVGVFLAGSANTSYVAWAYTTGAASGSMNLALPVSLPQGTYELRLFANGSYTRLATSNTFTLGAGCTGSASLSASPASVPAGGSVTATWSGLCGPTSRDWIGVFLPGAANTSYVAWAYSTGAASGSISLALAASLPQGTYELRLFSNGGYTRLATSNTFAVGAACTGGANLSASPASVPRGGTVTATWSNVCSPTSRDWIGIFAPGAPNSYYVAWRYTTGTASGSVPLTVPSSLAPGTYELRLFANNGYLLLGKSNAFTVTSP
jgi:hypothetical protein